MLNFLIFSTPIRANTLLLLLSSLSSSILFHFHSKCVVKGLNVTSFCVFLLMLICQLQRKCSLSRLTIQTWTHSHNSNDFQIISTLNISIELQTMMLDFSFFFDFLISVLFFSLYFWCTKKIIIKKDSSWPFCKHFKNTYHIYSMMMMMLQCFLFWSC